MSSRTLEPDEEGGMVQAGRSSVALDVERDSAEIRSKASTPVIYPDTSTTALLPVSSTTQLERQSSAGSLNKRSSYAPATPSPLNPSSKSTSISSNDGGEASGQLSLRGSESSGELGQSPSSGDLRAQGRAKRRTGVGGSPAQQFVRQKAMTALRAEETSRPGSPKQLKELGHDYSRYPSTVSLYRQSRAVSKAVSLSAPLLPTTTKNPSNDSQEDLQKWGYPDDSIVAFNPYCGGEKGFILYNDEIEPDDSFHVPGPDDDEHYKPRFSDYTNFRALVSALGGVFLVLGLLCVFIVLPVLTYSTTTYGGYGGDAPNYINTGPAWAHVNNNTYPLLNNVRKGLIDPDTPTNAMHRTSTFDGSTLNLVFSDEFNVDNRTFYPGDDPYWTAANIWYGATQDLEWYDPVAVTTGGGTLQLRMDSFPNHNLQFQSGMLNSWNQLCFKGGVMEVSVSLAGPSGIPGLWPGIWSMGNLGRPGYKATTEGVWPYSYNECDIGITPNQSSPDGLSKLPGQKLSSCTCKGQDHPNPGTGRGAPEIDILEASVDPNNRIGVVTQSIQIAPFDIWYRPNADFMQIPNYETTQMNAYCGGPFQQAVSGTTLLNNDWYDGEEYQKYAFEYIPGTSQGKIAWFVGEDKTFMVDGRAIGPNGNAGAREISQEPMSMVLNLGISDSWSEVLLGDLKFPTIMHIDYVRIYQRPGQTSITCDPPGYPTTEYIKNHPEPYNNPNLTAWNETGYAWPTNTLTGC